MPVSYFRPILSTLDVGMRSGIMRDILELVLNGREDLAQRPDSIIKVLSQIHVGK